MCSLLRKFTFLKNAFILTATSLLLRTIGMFFRIYMSNKIGAEGMGLYQLIFSVYMLAIIFSTSGSSVAVTRLVSEEAPCGTKNTIARILSRAMAMSVLLGLIASAAMYFGADLAAEFWLCDMRASTALRILSFSLPFMAAGSCLRGYFIARRRALTPSNAQILEQLIRIAIIAVLLDRFVPMGIGYACAAVVFGNTVSEIISCLYLYIAYRFDLRRLVKGAGKALLPGPKIVFKLARIGVPILGSSLLNTALRTIENLMVPEALTRYTASKERSLSQFGMLKGMAIPVLFFPSSFLGALSTLLIPEISEANSHNQREKTKRTVIYTLHITTMVSILIGGAFTIYASELGQLIYKSGEVGLYIKVLAPIVPFMYLESVIDGILKGLDQQVSFLRYGVLDSVLRITLITFLVPRNGIYAFLIIMVISNFTTSVLKIRRLFKVARIGIQWGRWITKPVLSILISSFLTLSLIRPQVAPPAFYVPAGILTLSAIYFLLLTLFGCVTNEDLRLLLKRSR